MRFFMLVFILAVCAAARGQELLFAAKEKGKPYGYVDEKGQYEIQPAFEEAGGFQNGIAIVSINKKYGVIDTQGKFLVQPIYDDAHLYAPEGYISVSKGSFWGVIDRNGKEILPFKFPYLSVVKEGKVVGGTILRDKKPKYFYNRLCLVILGIKGDTLYLESEECSDFSYTIPGTFDKNGFYSEGGWPMVQNGKIVIQEVYEDAYEIFDLRSKTQMNIYDSRFPDRYYRFREGTLALNSYFGEGGETDTTYGYFADTISFRPEYLGNLKNSFDFIAKRVHPFFNGVAMTTIADKIVFIDRDGDVIARTNLSANEYTATPPMYFNGLVGLYGPNGKAGFINLKGETVIPFTLDGYHPFEYDVTPAKQKGLYGILRKDGTWAVQPRFEELYIAPCPCYQ